MTDGRFFLFGDSHTAALGRGAGLLGLPFIGGATMRGRFWDEGRFHLKDDGRLEVGDAVGAELLANSLAEAGTGSLFTLDMPIVTTAAFVMETVVREIAERHVLSIPAPGSGQAFISSAFFRDIVLARRRKTCDLLIALKKKGRTVIAVTPPPRLPCVEVARAFQRVVIDELGRFDIPVVDTSLWAAGPDGLLLKHFESDNEGDEVHGNSLYGAHAAGSLAPHIGLDRSRYRDVLDQLSDPAFMRKRKDEARIRHRAAARSPR